MLDFTSVVTCCCVNIYSVIVELDICTRCTQSHLHYIEMYYFKCP